MVPEVMGISVGRLPETNDIVRLYHGECSVADCLVPVIKEHTRLQ